MKEKTSAPTQEAPGATIDHAAEAYRQWLEKVEEIVRKALHSDERLLEDSLHRVMAPRMSAGLSKVPPKARFAALPALVKQVEPTEDDLAAARALCGRKQAVRDMLVALIGGKQEGESWDDAFYRARASRRRLGELGRALHQAQVITPPPQQAQEAAP